jgi:hypothetical protein
MNVSGTPLISREIARGTLQRCRVPRSLLSGTWASRVETEVRRDEVTLDAVVTLEAPDGSSIMLVVEAKRLVAMRDLPNQPTH